MVHPIANAQFLDLPTIRAVTLKLRRSQILSILRKMSLIVMNHDDLKRYKSIK